MEHYTTQYDHEPRITRILNSNPTSSSRRCRNAACLLQEYDCTGLKQRVNILSGDMHTTTLKGAPCMTLLNFTQSSNYLRLTIPFLLLYIVLCEHINSSRTTPARPDNWQKTSTGGCTALFVKQKLSDAVLFLFLTDCPARPMQGNVDRGCISHSRDSSSRTGRGFRSIGV